MTNKTEVKTEHKNVHYGMPYTKRNKIKVKLVRMILSSNQFNGS